VRVRTAIGRGFLGTAAGVLVLPAVAAAGGPRASGGATAPSAATHVTGATGATGAAVSTGGGLTIAPASVMRGQNALVTGSLPAAAGRTVWLQVRGTARRWSTVASATAAGSGAFAISWPASRAGELTLRVASPVLATPATAAVARRLSATPTGRLAVFSPVVATWYGPGFYGNHTACGEILTHTIVGVADRTLRCGTPVTVSYEGRTLTLPVIDRGPYSGPATLDLTHAAAQELGMTETVPVGMLVLRGPAIAPGSYVAPGSAPAGGTGASGPASTAGGATAPPS
jgi:rare lipoprotein A